MLKCGGGGAEVAAGLPTSEQEWLRRQSSKLEVFGGHYQGARQACLMFGVPDLLRCHHAGTSASASALVSCSVARAGPRPLPAVATPPVGPCPPAPPPTPR